MIHIITVHHKTPKFIDLQVSHFQKYTNQEHRIYLGKFQVGDSYVSKPYASISLEKFPQWKRHGERMNLIAKSAFESEKANLKDDDLLVFVDSDAFPIDNWVDKVRGYLKNVPIVAVQRRENIEPLLKEEQKNYPHPSFFVTTVGFWKNNNLSWRLDPSRGASTIGVLLKEWLEKNNHEWKPLLRTNDFNLHPLYFGVYDDMVYHHGAGNRIVYDSIDIWSRKELSKKYGVGIDLSHPEIPQFNLKLSTLVYDQILQDKNFIKVYFCGRE